MIPLLAAIAAPLFFVSPLWAAPAFSGRQADLLRSQRYQVKADGSVWPPEGASPLAPDDVPYLIGRLESAQRLRALLQLKLVLVSSEGEKNLTEAEREKIRTIVRDNWPLFTLRMRRKFKAYFGVAELERMNRDPAPFDEEFLPPLKDIEPDPAAFAAAPAPAPRGLPVATEPTVIAGPPALPAPGVAGAGVPPPLPTGSGPPPTAVPGAAPPVAAAASPAPAPTYPLPAEAARLPPPPITPAAPAAAPPPVETSAPAPGVDGAGVPPPLPIGIGLTPPREISHADFEKFLADAPYGREAKPLLRLISEKAPAPARARALDAVMSLYPQVLFDAGRCGADPHGALLSEEFSGAQSFVIALNPEAILLSRRSLFGGRRTFLLPESAGFYASLHLPLPDLEALKRDAVAVKEESGDWGRTRLYADGSSRGSTSHLQQAGTLLRKLLELDAARRGADAAPRSVQAYALTAQWLFFARAMTGPKDELLLDPETRLNYKHWRDHPAEYRDHLAHALSAGRSGASDAAPAEAQGRARAEARAAGCLAELEGRRTERQASVREARLRDLLAVSRAGLFETKQLEASEKALLAEAPPAAPEMGEKACQGLAAREEAGLKEAAALEREIAAAEGEFREERRIHDQKP